MLDVGVRKDRRDRMMKNTIDIYDRVGEKLSVGDSVLYIKVDDHLLRDLPDEDQAAIKAQEGKAFRVLALDSDGRAEIEFEYEKEDSEITFHTIWVSPNCLKKIPN